MSQQTGFEKWIDTAPSPEERARREHLGREAAKTAEGAADTAGTSFIDALHDLRARCPGFGELEYREALGHAYAAHK